jgi:adenosylmethionine-8-amino-7-oxononanoate aminotransferase
VIGFCAEPVVGAAGGAIPPTPDYFRGVRALCDKYGILFIADEVMCGMGRTGTMFAIEQDGVAPDLIAVGKGLGAGYQPIGAVLVNGAVVERLQRCDGVFPHRHTYTSHPVAAAAALAVLDVMERDDLLAQVKKRGATLRRMLGDVFGGHPHVGDIRGRGLFQALELVRDRVTREPFAPELNLHAAIRRQAMQRGLLVYPKGGTIDGRRGDHVLLAPPFIVSAAQLSEIAARLEEAVNAAIREVLL